MSCKAVENGEVKRKGKASIEYHDNNGKPVYYCNGWIDSGTDDLMETCSNCKKNVLYAQRDLEAINDN